MCWYRYVEMTCNDKTNYVARELKSVHVDVQGSYIKFIIHKNHLNRLNIYHQVNNDLTLYNNINNYYRYIDHNYFTICWRIYYAYLG